MLESEWFLTADIYNVEKHLYTKCPRLRKMSMADGDCRYKFVHYGKSLLLTNRYNQPSNGEEQGKKAVFARSVRTPEVSFLEMRTVPIFPAVCGGLLVLLLIKIGFGQTSSQDQVLNFLDELDKLAGPKSYQENKGHFCKYFEPHTIRTPRNYKRRTVKRFQVPCTEGDEKIKPCIKYRVVFEPEVRQVTKSILRGVRRCCKGWNGVNCNEREKEVPLNEKRQFVQDTPSAAKTCIPSCQNNGLCSHGLCFCLPGYTGKSCEKGL
ncbi:unnamed protein product [Porites lobata]|uniref:EGF-like domain-containing protein n=1 Tax=Porites lobata TaxID=104759 RepID=A0ABN8QIZ3_9CNID|nr:unnamed protein product [Porites lobata]